MVEGRGRAVGHQMPGSGGPQGVAVLATVRAAMSRRATDPNGPRLTADDVREPRRAERRSRTVVLCVDASGSMGTKARVDAATGAVVALLADAYLQRDQVALVAFRGTEAVEVLPATGSVELARARLADLPTGGPTPLAEGIATGLTVARRAGAKGSHPLLVLLTDGRATGRPGALDHARESARAVAAAGVDAVVLDAEPASPTALGLARELATLMSARHIPLETISPTAIESAVRTSLLF
jgi:magnesium chelatase subunit D